MVTKCVSRWWPQYYSTTVYTRFVRVLYILYSCKYPTVYTLLLIPTGPTVLTFYVRLMYEMCHQSSCHHRLLLPSVHLYGWVPCCSNPSLCRPYQRYLSGFDIEVLVHWNSVTNFALDVPRIRHLHQHCLEDHPLTIDSWNSFVLMQQFLKPHLVGHRIFLQPLDVDPYFVIQVEQLLH